MPHVVTRPLYPGKELVITADNSGAIGEKEQDAVYIPNETAGYFSCRVAMMELLAAGAEPHTIVLHNFTGDEAWHAYEKGVHQILRELNSSDVSITGSTESNMSSVQSGLGLTVIGLRDTPQPDQSGLNDLHTAYAVIGTPLVGEEVKEQRDKTAPLALFGDFCRMKEIIALLPVGSKGIQTDWQTWTGSSYRLDCTLDIMKSAGPATCFIIAFQREYQPLLVQQAGSYFHELKIAQHS